MNIYIYGNQSFKKDIHQTLDHANIKFKLDSDSIIKDIDNLEELKNTIKSNPNDIYLIDDEKIIKKNSLNQKIKFLTPKDGIEQEFLLDNNIADLSVDSLAEIPKYILKKHEQEKSIDSSIHDSIIGIVDEAYEKESEETEKIKNEDEFDIDELELDDELADLLSKNTSEEDDIDINSNENEEILAQDVNLDDMEEFMKDMDNLSSSDNKEDISDEEFKSLMNFDEDFGLNNVSFDYDDENLVDEKNTKEINIEIEDENNLLDEDFDESFLENIEIEKDNENIESTDEDFLKNIENEDELKDLFDNIDIETNTKEKGEVMDDEFSELNSLSEEDILNALDGFETQSVSKNISSPKPETKKETQSVNVSSTSVDDIAQLISKLLNNKTLEITIKIKD